MDWFTILKCFYLVSAIGSALFVRFYAPDTSQGLGIELFAIFMPLFNTALAFGFFVTFTLDVVLVILNFLTRK